MNETRQEAIEALTRQAADLGDREGNDAHIERLQELLLKACSLLSNSQWAEFSQVGGTQTSQQTVIAKFQPQAWVNDYAIAVDPEGPTEFDVTAEVIAMGREASMLIEDAQYSSDDLRDASAAPQWIKEWAGPFSIEVQESIKEFWESRKGACNG